MFNKDQENARRARTRNLTEDIRAAARDVEQRQRRCEVMPSDLATLALENATRFLLRLTEFRDEAR